MTHAQSEEESTGKLVVVPSRLGVGETTEAVAFHVEPRDLEVYISYSGHFVAENESCDSAAPGSSASSVMFIVVKLRACEIGPGVVRLLKQGSDQVIREFTVTITETVARAQASPTVSLSSIRSTMRPGTSDSFSVNVSGISRNLDYELTTVPLNNPDSVAFDDECDVQEKVEDISSRTSYRKSYTAYACRPVGTGMWAYLKQGEDYVANSGPSGNRIKVPHEISISGPRSVDEDDDEIDFTVSSEFSAVSSIRVRVSVSETASFLDGTPPSSVTIRKGKTSATLTVQLDDDGVCESNGSITANILSDRTTSDDPYLVGSSPSKRVTVSDDDGGPICDRPEPECDSAPSSVRNLEVDPGDKRLNLDWDKPTVDGDCDIDYRVERKLASSSSWGNRRTVTTTSATYTGLANRTQYNVRVRACNDYGCSGWTQKSGTPQSPPDQVLKPRLTPGNRSLDVSWDAPARGTTPTSYQGQYKESTVPVWTGASSFTSTSTSKTIVDLDSGTSYNVRVRACHGKRNCGPWSPMAAATLKPPLATPSDLTVTPMSERRAKLTWDAVAGQGSIVYDVQVREGTSGSWGYWRKGVKSSRGIPETYHEIELDSVVNSKGLADEDSFQFQVRARNTTTNSESSFSETITIIDSPIVSINGDSRLPSGMHGPPFPKAVVSWDKPSGATGYTLRWRKLGGKHKSLDWELNQTTYPDSYPADNKKSITNQNDTTFTVRGPANPLDFEEIYAFQLNYTTSSGKVFSARDRFVWPSIRAAGYGERYAGERVASFPLKEPNPNKTYSYAFCDSTFPTDRLEDWKRLISHAFSQWELATNHLITIKRTSLKCLDFSNFVEQIRASLAYFVANFLPGEGDPSDEQIATYTRHLLDNLHQAGVDEKALGETIENHELLNEVLMYDDVDFPANILKPAGVFPEVSREVGHGSCYPRGACVSRRERKLRDGATIVTRDVLLSREQFIVGSFIVPGTDDKADSGEVLFNHCKKPLPDRYKTLVHEFGHALGIGGGNTGSGHNQVGHPQIRDSALSYSPTDPMYMCSPHPLDILAIYALYQSQ